MPLWEPNVEIPQILHHSSITRKNNTHECSSSSSTTARPNPDREAARMAALKRLRHQFLQHCKKNNSTIKPPVLAFERWLGRAALRQQFVKNSQNSTKTTNHNQSHDWDPILPSDGHVCEGLIKDLTRTDEYDDENYASSAAAATMVASKMAEESKSMAAKVALKGASPSSLPNFNTTMIQDEMKQNVKTIQNVAKLTRKLLKKKSKDSGRTKEDDDDDVNESSTQKDDDSISSTNDDSMKTTLLNLQQATQALAGSIRKAQYLTGQGGLDSAIHISNSRRSGIYDVALVDSASPHRQQLKKPYLTVSSSHLEKLIELWNLQKQRQNNYYNNNNNNKGKNGNDSNNGRQQNRNKSDLPSILSKLQSDADSDDDNTKLFLQTLYSCLARYEGLKGAGYQCAVPGIAFDAARSCGLGITIECFASPLNCRYGQYCSAFPDLEWRFGSLGSFFDDATFFPCEGSFEVNPPFIPDIMTAMGDKLVRILQHEEAGPLSFLVVIPAWGTIGIQFVEELENSIYNYASLRVPAAEHAFCDGAQHTKPSASSSTKSFNNENKKSKIDSNEGNPELRPSSWDTAVILLQNEKGSHKWPVTTTQLEESFGIALRNASKTIPEAYATLDAWEQRGVSQGGSASGWNGKRRWKQSEQTQLKKTHLDDIYTSSHTNKRKRW